MDLTPEVRRYKIGQAAKMLDLKPYVLRFWETEFPDIAPRRSPSGQRSYTEEQIERIRALKHLLYTEGLTIEGARRRLQETGRQDILRSVRDELAAIRALLDPSSGA